MKIVLVRHGQSVWNKENKFTGWYDAPLSEQGFAEAKLAGEILKEENFVFDRIYTSVLKRAIITGEEILRVMDLSWIPVEKAWQLNERHYGALMGLNKKETVEKHGAEQVHIWRRSYSTPPPAMDIDDPRHPRFEDKYKNVPADLLPTCESLKDTVNRVIPYWESTIAPALQAGERVILSAHGNSIRALYKYLLDISEDEISEVNIPTGQPLVIELDKQLKGTKDYYLGDAEKIQAQINEVKNQT